MALKKIYESLEAVPEKFRGLYELRENKAVLTEDFEDLAPKDKLDEFRANNIKLLKDLEKFKGMDPAKYAELTEAAKRAEEEAAKKAGKFDEVISQRVQAVKTEFETQLNSTKDENTKLKTRLDATVIENGVSLAASGQVRPEALEDLLLRAKNSIRVTAEGTPEVLDADQQVAIGTDGKPLTIKGWIERMKTKAPHLFVGSNGGGAANAQSGAAGGEGANPWKKESWNVTKQMQLRKSSPERARMLAAQAGARF